MKEFSNFIKLKKKLKALEKINIGEDPPYRWKMM
jgi:hypothetical protein